MTEFTVWEVYAEVLNRDLGGVRQNHGLYSEYYEALMVRDYVADELAKDGLDFEVIVKGRKVNERGR